MTPMLGTLVALASASLVQAAAPGLSDWWRDMTPCVRVVAMVVAMDGGDTCSPARATMWTESCDGWDAAQEDARVERCTGNSDCVTCMLR